MFGQEAWEERYRADPVWSGRPNPQLTAEVDDLDPGLALEAGSGEGADALWLAERGWTVTAVDFSRIALQRAAAHAQARGADVAARITWQHSDLTTWGPGPGRFDLVSAQFLHLPQDLRDPLFARLAAGVAPGGTLLIVGHHPHDIHSGAHRPPAPDMFFTAESVAATLDPAGWDVVVADTRSRTGPGPGPDAPEMTLRDAVLRARRRT